jgi:alpha-beta hydrolase superfamily lysophospholipase
MKKFLAMPEKATNMSQDLIMKPVVFFCQSTDAVNLYAEHWPVAKEKLKGIIQIAHGLGENAHYYREFSETAAQAGFSVYIHEARGHGRTAGDVNSPDYADKGGDAGKDGFVAMREDLHTLTRHIRERHPQIPVFLLGHSMGALVAALYASQYGSDISGLITTGAPLYALDSERLLPVAEKEIALHGLKAPCRTVFQQLFGHLNASFEPARTMLDWVTSDAEMIEESLQLLYTYVLFNNEFYRDFLRTLQQVQQDERVYAIPGTLPVYLLSGGRDVITENGHDTLIYQERYQHAGVLDVQYKIYENKRHSILREVNRAEVWEDIFRWIGNHISHVPRE